MIEAGITMKCKIHFSKGSNGHLKIVEGAKPPEEVNNGRIPRVTRLMALAIHFEGLLKKGTMRDFAEIANLGYVSRARLTQIMNLLLLAPDIQEDLLFLPRTFNGTDAILERDMRAVSAELSWKKQREIWQETQKD